MPTLSALPRFQCTACGDCCRGFQSDYEPPCFDDSGLLVLHPMRLPFFDFEAEVFEQRGITVLPAKVLVDLKADQAIVVECTFAQQDCPLLDGDRCTAHGRKPLTCDAYPCNYRIAGNRIQATFYDGKCPAEMPRKDLLRILGMQEGQQASIARFEQGMKERYGPSFDADRKKKATEATILSFLRTLTEQGVIRPAKPGYDPAQLKRRAERMRMIPVSTLFAQHTGKSLRSATAKD